MSIESVVSFWAAVEKDDALQAQVNPAGGKVPALSEKVESEQLADLAAIAGGAGYDATPQEFATVEAVLRFWDAVASSPDLQAQLAPTQDIGSAEQAADAVSEIATGAGYAFTGPELMDVTAALAGTGWMMPDTEDAEVSGFQFGSTSTPQLPSLAFNTSLKLAVNSQLQTSFRRIGPGQVAEYM